MRRTLTMVALALAGIALTAAITWGTSQLVRQRIGLASEPLSAGRRLLPSSTASGAAAAPRPAKTVTRTVSTPAPLPVQTTPPARTAPPAQTTTPVQPTTPAQPTERPASSGREPGDSSRERDD